MATSNTNQPVEGAMRINPTTKQVETYTPEGVWSSEILEKQVAGISSQVQNLTQRVASEGITPTSTTDLSKSQAEPFTPPPTTSDSTWDSYSQGLTDALEKQRAALESAYNTQLANAQKQIEEANKKQQEFLATQKDILETQVKPLTEPFRADIETAERERLKVEENYFQNQQLTNELDTLLTQIQADLQREKDITGLAAIREPRIEKATEEAAARVGVIEAVMAARNNQITVAENLIDRTVAAMTADRNDQHTYYNAFLSFYDKQVDIEGKKIVALTEQEQGWIKSKIGLLENDLAITQQNVENIKAAMTDPDTALAYASAGVTLNDTPEQINVKLAKYGYTKELADTSNAMAADGYSYLVPGQTAPSGSQVITTTDSQGKKKQWYKEVEASGGGNIEPLSILDIQRLKELYGDTGIVLGDTQLEAERKVYYAYTLPQIVQQYKDKGYSKEEVEETIKIENDLSEVPMEVQTIIDETYKEEPKKKSWWSWLPWVD